MDQEFKEELRRRRDKLVEEIKEQKKIAFREKYKIVTMKRELDNLSSLVSDRGFITRKSKKKQTEDEQQNNSFANA